MKTKIFIIGFIIVVFISLTNSCTNVQRISPLDIEENINVDKDLQNWIYDTFTKDYNINVVYTRDGYSSKLEVVSPKHKKIKEVLSFIDNILLQSIKQTSGNEFVRKYMPKEIHLFGGRNLNSYGSELAVSSNIGNILSVYNVNSFDINDIHLQEKLAREIFSEYAKFLLEENHSILEKFAKTNFSPYNRWDISGDESKRVYNNKRAIMLRFGFFSDAAQLSQVEDIVETISALITTKPKDLNDEIRSATEIPSYLSGTELVETTNRVENAKKTISEKIRLSTEYLKNNFNIDVKKLNNSVISNIKAFPSNYNNKKAND